MAHAWAESSAHGSGDEEVEIPLILLIKIPQRLGDLDARPEQRGREDLMSGAYISATLP